MSFLDPKPLTPGALDTAVTAKINDTGSAARGALNATFGPTAAPMTAAFSSVSGKAATAANTQRFLTKLYRGVEDASVLHIGTSLGNETIEYVNLTWTQFASRFPAYTFIIHGWDETGGAAYDTGSAGAATTIQTGTGSKTVNIWRACAAGMRTDYLLGSRWQAAVVDPAPDLIFVEHGKNEGNSTAANPTMWRGQYLALTESLTQVHPYAGLVCILEPLNTADDDMALKNKVYEELAQLRGYGLINAHDAFLATGTPTAYIKVDGIHPTTSADAPAPNGSQLMADTILRALSLDVKTGGQQAQLPSSLAGTGEQLLSNGNFAAFSGAAPDGFTLVGCTASKDTRAGYFESPNGYSVRIQATGAAQSYIRGDLSVAPNKGKWVTVAVRMRIPAGAGGTSGRISLTDGVSNITSSSSLSSARDGFHWKVLTIKVATTAAYLRVLVYGDSAANASADISIDRIDVVEGVLPKKGSQGAVGPAGPVGPSSPTLVDHLSTLGTNPLLTMLGSSSVTQNSANQAILVPFKPQRAMSIAIVQWVCAVSSGNYDIGIYDASGTKLWSKGSTVFGTAGALQVETVSPSVPLTAGTTYYLAWSADNTTGSPRGIVGTAAGWSGFQQMLDGTSYTRLVSSSFPLPSSIVLGSTSSIKMPAVVFREA